MYKEAVVQKTQAEASNVGAVTNVVGNVAMTIASIGAIAVGGAMAGGAVAGGTAGATAGAGASGAGAVAGAVNKAQLGMQIQKMGIQMIGRQIGGFSGIVISSNIADAYQSYTYKNKLNDMMSEANEKTKSQKKLAQMPANIIAKNWSQAEQLLKEENNKNEIGGAK